MATYECGLIGLLFAAIGLFPQQNTVMATHSIAKVNGFELSVDEYKTLLAKIIDIVPSGIISVEEQQQKILEIMIDEHLLAQQAIALQLPLNDSRLREMLARSIIEWQTTEVLSEVVDESTLQDFYQRNKTLFQGNESLHVEHMRFRCAQGICSVQGKAYKLAKTAFEQLEQGHSFTDI